MRSALAKNPNSPERLLLRLSDDDDPDVRIALASSPFMSTDIMEKLSNDIKGEVVEALYQNSTVPEYILNELAQILVNNDERNTYDDLESDEDFDITDHDFDCSPHNVYTDDWGDSYYQYGDMWLPYHDGGVEYDGKFYEVMGGEDSDPMFFDENNGWLTDLP